MRKLKLKNITLLGVDCLDISRLALAVDISREHINFGAVKLLSSIEDSSYNITKIKPITNINQYSKFMIRELNRYVTTDFVLTIQHDGFVLNPDAWTDEFLRYDYIGAPWWYKDGKNVGNGGFSLRSKKLLRILATDKHIRKFSPEDHHICRTYRKYLEGKGIRFAPEYLAARFSVEGNIHQFKTGQNVWSGQFGFHDTKKTILRAWFAKNPKYKKVVTNTLKESYRLK